MIKHKQRVKIHKSLSAKIVMLIQPIKIKWNIITTIDGMLFINALNSQH